MNKILLVEDSKDDVELMLRALQQNNITSKVDVVKDGEQALDYLSGQGDYVGRNIHDLPQIILLDLKLPKMDGLEVLKHIRSVELTRYIPVVVLTSSKEASDLKESYHLGANSYIQKPLDFSRFIEVVREIAVYWLTWNEQIHYDSC